MKRTIALVLLLCAVTVGWSGCCCPCGKGEIGRPNIIWIMADDLGYGDLGCYGQKVIRTPNIDRLAAEGMRFTQAYAGSTVCAPSRCALMTGLHTGHCWVRGNARVPLRPEDVTVAEVLKEAGYTTGIIGKWGLGEPDTTGVPNRQGFDYWFGYLNQRNAHNYYPDFLWRNEEKVALPNEQESPQVAKTRVVYSHHLFAEESLKWVEKHHKEPFFLYLAYTLPHANNERGSAKGDGMEIPSYGEYADKPWANPQKGHAAMISRLDADVGRLMKKLGELGIDDRTIVFFTSDNGPHREGGADPAFFKSSGPLSGYKRSLTDGGIRVPMIARWPGRIEAGSESDYVWAFWDFLPTAAELAGAKAPEKLDGVSVLPVLKGEKRAREDFLYWEFHERGSKQAVRWGRWKGIRMKPGGPIELYDVAADIAEKNNVAAQHPDVVKKIEDYLKTVRTDNPTWKMSSR